MLLARRLDFYGKLLVLLHRAISRCPERKAEVQ
jgi:hypothetical protein